MRDGAVTCPHCGAPMPLDENRVYFYCAYCSSYYVPDPNIEGVTLLEEKSSLKCPLCATTLVAAAASGVRILACPNCHGNLIQHFNLRPIIEAAQPTDSGLGRLNRPPDLPERRRKLVCPSCHRIMESYPYGGPGAVIIQGCGSCRLIWLDFGELSKIIWSSQHAQASVPDEWEQGEGGIVLTPLP